MTPAQILVLLLARTCIAEIGFQGSTDECVLMWQVNQTNAERKGISLKVQTLNYNQYWVRKSHRKHRPWIAYLEGKDKPKFWSKSLKWKAHVKKWLQIKKEAQKFVNGYYTKGLCKSAID